MQMFGAEYFYEFPVWSCSFLITVELVSLNGHGLFSSTHLIFNKAWPIQKPSSVANASDIADQ